MEREAHKKACLQALVEGCNQLKAVKDFKAEDKNNRFNLAAPVVSYSMYIFNHYPEVAADAYAIVSEAIEGREDLESVLDTVEENFMNSCEKPQDKNIAIKNEISNKINNLMMLMQTAWSRSIDPEQLFNLELALKTEINDLENNKNCFSEEEYEMLLNQANSYVRNADSIITKLEEVAKMTF